jgi:predicted  nucleic acid-binding Zn-ribbon protein
MLKNIIAPVQAWLLSKGQCVGCGMSLSRGKKIKAKNGNKKITCRCGRIFIYNPRTKKYRRALFEEV